MNFRNINKSLMIEFMNCELDSSNIVFNSHNCSSSNAPTTSLISNFINTGMNMKNPYSTKSSAISSNPCILGTVSITTPSGIPILVISH